MVIVQRLPSIDATLTKNSSMESGLEYVGAAPLPEK
jgi:hypothetical protein